MAYIPGFEYDIFVSYAHGDDRDWIDRLIDRLKSVLKRLLGVEATFWIDDADLRRSRDFRQEIPSSIDSSAVFLFFPSPMYIRSQYCIRVECPHFERTVLTKRGRFGATDFANEQFALRCPLLPIENNEHWDLFPGLTDIAFCDGSEMFPHGSPDFEVSFRRLTGELKQLLQRMRNRSTPVFLYPPRPSDALIDAHMPLSKELAVQNYRLLPDRLVNLPGQLREAQLAVFLMNSVYDQDLDDLTQIAKTSGRPWVVWCSPGCQDGEPEQLGLIRNLQQFESPTNNFTFLNETIDPRKLKEEVLAILKPSVLATSQPSEKPKVYLVYNSRDRRERGNAGQIAYHYRTEFHFDYADDPAQHNARLANSDGVLLVWGTTDEQWCTPEFQSMMQVPGRAQAKGLCLFDPAEQKIAVMDQIRKHGTGVHILEQFGPFEPGRMESFFNPIRQNAAGGAQ